MNKTMMIVLGMSLVVGCGSADSGGFPNGNAPVDPTTTTVVGSGGASVATTMGTAGQAGTSVGNTTGTAGTTGGSDLTTTATTGDLVTATTVGTSGAGGGDPSVAGAGGSGGSDTVGTAGAGGDPTTDVDGGNAGGSAGAGGTVDSGNDVVIVVDAGNDAPVPNQCVRSCSLTSGYWLNHSTWCVVPVVMGGAAYSQSDATALIALPSINDGSVILAQQLVAAIENGIASDTSSSSAAMYSAAQDWMTNNRPDGGTLPYNVSATSDAGIVAVAIGASLDNYNQGKSGVKPHCPE